MTKHWALTTLPSGQVATLQTCPTNNRTAKTTLTDNLVYKATVKVNNAPEKIYIGMTEHAFKTRFNGHKVSLKYSVFARDVTDSLAAILEE